MASGNETDNNSTEAPATTAKSSPRVRVAKRVVRKTTKPLEDTEKTMLERLYELRSPRPLPFEKMNMKEERLRKAKSDLDPILRLHHTRALARKKRLKPSRPTIKRSTVVSNLPL